MKRFCDLTANLSPADENLTFVSWLTVPMLHIQAVIANPGSLLLALLILSLPLSWWRRSRRFGVGLGLLALAVILPLGVPDIRDRLGAPLEDRYPIPVLPDRVDGLIVLGGAERPRAMALRGIPELNASADRLVAFVALARQYPQAKLVFTGGSATPHPLGAVTEADVAQAVFARFGLDPARVTYERTSGNTAENARNSRALVQPQPGEAWLLITSARHMPRAVSSFATQGWSVLPYPVDFRTGQSEPWIFSPLEGVLALNSYGREWLGLIGYRAMGYTAEILPPRRALETKP
jgi:uncharacterized SAM-binding protein YcdF (DUF218 family)